MERICIFAAQRAGITILSSIQKQTLKGAIQDCWLNEHRGILPTVVNYTQRLTDDKNRRQEALTDEIFY